MFTTSFVQPTTAHSPADAEGWARAVFERGPVALRWFVIIGWRIVLGLRLGPAGSPDHVAGWRIAAQTPDRVTLEASSYLINARNIVEVGSIVRWRTEVEPKHAIARPIWLLALPIHRLSIRYLLRRSASRG